MKVMPIIMGVLGAGMGATHEKEDRVFHAVLLGLAGYGLGTAVSNVTDAADEADKKRSKEEL